jgi:hypothetical protein
MPNQFEKLILDWQTALSSKKALEFDISTEHISVPYQDTANSHASLKIEREGKTMELELKIEWQIETLGKPEEDTKNVATSA